MSSHDEAIRYPKQRPQYERNITSTNEEFEIPLAREATMPGNANLGRPLGQQEYEADQDSNSEFDAATFSNFHAKQSPAQSSWEADSGLLEGSTGIALALMAASTDIEPEWDWMLLVSPRSQHFTPNPQD